MIGLLGGTFDPFHKGHEALAKSALDQLGLDRLVLMPVGRPPHKSRRTSFAAYRYEMARLGVEGLEGALVSDDEIRTPGRDYTLHTVLRMKKDLGGEPLLVIVGSDQLFSFDDWYQPGLLLKEAGLAVAVRGQEDSGRVREEADRVGRRYGRTVSLFDMPRLGHSATDLRAQLELGEGDPGQFPDKVAAFLGRYRPYAFSESFQAVSPEGWQRLLDLEEAVWSCQSQERRLHAASVAQYAARLALVYGIDPETAAAAGLLHDAAKELPEDRQRELAAAYYGKTGQAGTPMESSSSEDLVHGPASARIALQLLGAGGLELAEAIVHHSTAAPDLAPLGEVLFLADKISYDRNFNQLDGIRALAEGGQLRQAMKACLEEVFLALEREGKRPCPLSLAAYEKYRAG